jgi:hypothetical protein
MKVANGMEQLHGASDVTAGVVTEHENRVRVPSIGYDIG